MAVAPSPASTAARKFQLWAQSMGLAPSRARASSKTDRVPDPGSRNTHSLAIRILERQLPLSAPGMVNPDDDQQLISRHRRALEKLVLHRSLDEPQFRCSPATAAATCAVFPTAR